LIEVPEPCPNYCDRDEVTARTTVSIDDSVEDLVVVGRDPHRERYALGA
jgi:hypothetical protein